MRTSFSVRVNQGTAYDNEQVSDEGMARVVGSKTGGKPYLWIGEVGSGYRAIINSRSMDAICRCWIALRKLRGEWK